MASLDSLPGDQRAVLQLVLGRGRSYDEIARLLSINPVAVRERALAALDALGPQTKMDRDHRAMIADYLLGQLSGGEVDEVRDRLSESASERAWARVLSSELAPLSNQPLPEIPVGGESRGAEPTQAPPLPTSTAAPVPAAGPEASSAGAGRARRRERASREEPAVPGPADPGGPVTPGAPPAPGGAPRSSRLGGAVMIGVAVVVVAVVLFLVLRSGGSNKHPAVASTPTSASTPAASASTTSTASTTPKVIAQINLTPTQSGSKAAGIAEVLNEGSTDGVAIVAQNVPPNTTKPPNAYAVWLYNTPTDAHFLGFVNPGVTSSGRLSTAGGLPSNAAHYKNLVVTVETSATPKTPGPIILRGALTGVS